MTQQFTGDYSQYAGYIYTYMYVGCASHLVSVKVTEKEKLGELDKGHVFIVVLPRPKNIQ